MKEQIISVQLSDGTSTKITTYNKAENPQFLILIFPAMGVSASYYKKFAIQLAQKGITAVTADLRGHGHSSVRPSRKIDYGYHEMIEIDYEAILKKVKKRYPNSKKYVLGHSLGGQIASLYLSKYQADFSGLILVACCSVYYKSWKGSAKYKIWIGTQLSNLIANIFGFYPGKKLGFAGTEGKTVIKDWSQQARTGKYLVNNNAHDFEASLQKLDLPVLVLSFQGDELAPKSAVEHLYQKFSSKAVIQHHHLKGTEKIQYSHFNWVKKSEEVIPLITNFLRQA